jgi:hypothetical protein
MRTARPLSRFRQTYCVIGARQRAAVARVAQLEARVTRSLRSDSTIQVAISTRSLRQRRAQVVDLDAQRGHAARSRRQSAIDTPSAAECDQAARSSQRRYTALFTCPYSSMSRRPTPRATTWGAGDPRQQAWN